MLLSDFLIPAILVEGVLFEATSEAGGTSWVHFWAPGPSRTYLGERQGFLTSPALLSADSGHMRQLQPLPDLSLSTSFRQRPQAVLVKVLQGNWSERDGLIDYRELAHTIVEADRCPDLHCRPRRAHGVLLAWRPAGSRRGEADVLVEIEGRKKPVSQFKSSQEGGILPYSRGSAFLFYSDLPWTG